MMPPERYIELDVTYRCSARCRHCCFTCSPDKQGVMSVEDARGFIGEVQKLGLSGFANVGPLEDALVQTDRVGIKLQQHIGQPCEPTVSVGQEVQVGQVVARPPTGNGQPALGAPVHASISGRVAAIADGVVWIEK